MTIIPPRPTSRMLGGAAMTMAHTTIGLTSNESHFAVEHAPSHNSFLRMRVSMVGGIC